MSRDELTILIQIHLY